MFIKCEVCNKIPTDPGYRRDSTTVSLYFVKRKTPEGVELTKHFCGPAHSVEWNLANPKELGK